MSLGNTVVISENPRGRYLPAIISGTPKPGTVMQIKAGTESVGGAFTWEVYNADADGNQRLIAVTVEDGNQGFPITTAYVTGTRGMVYCPLPGDELNMLVANIPGTSDSFAIGDLLMVDDGTGKLIATTSSPESEAFVCAETVATLTADAHVHCFFTGY